jgi:hypothetical protein
MAQTMVNVKDEVADEIVDFIDACELHGGRSRLSTTLCWILRRTTSPGQAHRDVRGSLPQGSLHQDRRGVSVVTMVMVLLVLMGGDGWWWWRKDTVFAS